MFSTNTSVSTGSNPLAMIYGLLSLTLIPTIGGAYVGMIMHIGSFGLMGALLMFGVMFGVVYGIKKSPPPVATALLFGFTFLMGLMMSAGIQAALSSPGGASIVINAGAMTVATFGVMSFIGATTKKDLGGLGKFLFVGLVILIVASLLNIFLHEPVLNLVIAAAGAILFSLYILFDVNAIVKGGNTDPLMATLALYLDIVNLFMSLLNLLMSLSGNSRD